MIIPDVNILVHACDPATPVYGRARDWLITTLSGPTPIGFSWHCILGFVRVSTNRRASQSPLTPKQAVGQIRDWLALPTAEIITPGDRHAEIFFGLIESLGTAGNLTSDAHLAALAIEYHAALASTDTDFARFPGLRWLNPLA